MKNLFKTEPALVLAVVTAILGLLVAFGVSITDVQSGAIVAAVSAVLALVQGAVTRSLVTPVAKDPSNTDLVS